MDGAIDCWWLTAERRCSLKGVVETGTRAAVQFTRWWWLIRPSRLMYSTHSNIGSFSEAGRPSVASGCRQASCCCNWPHVPCSVQHALRLATDYLLSLGVNDVATWDVIKRAQAKAKMWLFVIVNVLEMDFSPTNKMSSLKFRKT